MTLKSQENNMRRLAELLGGDLRYIGGERECGPNGNKKVFLNLGKVFLRALAKDLGLRDVKVTSNAAGIGLSGDCHLYGMWEDSGIYICLSQPVYLSENVLLYRSIRNMRDYKGGYNHYIRRTELETMNYLQVIDRLSMLRSDVPYERAA